MRVNRFAIELKRNERALCGVRLRVSPIAAVCVLPINRQDKLGQTEPVFAKRIFQTSLKKERESDSIIFYALKFAVFFPP